MVVAPLTVTVDRERVVDFTKSFLSFDLKSDIKSKEGTGSSFTFLRPFSAETWVIIFT